MIYLAIFAANITIYSEISKFFYLYADFFISLQVISYNTSMTISVIIPVYKVENYIQRCLESVIAQECDDFDIECILVDDCSPDMSMGIAKDIIDHYHGSINFRIISNIENLGPSTSRNNGLKVAKGDYIYYLDSDDHLSKNCLSSLFREINQYGCVVDMVIGNSFNYNSGHCWLKEEKSPFLLLNHADIMRRFLRIELPTMAWNKLIRRPFLLDNNLVFRPGMLHEDELWSYELYNVVSSVVLIPDVTYYYEQVANSIMNSSSNLVRRTEGYHILVSRMLNTLCHDLYVDRFFWGIYMYMKSEAIIRTENLSGEIVSENKQLRRLMVNRSLADFRILIFIFLLLTVVPPFHWLIRFRWFRQNYSWFRKLLRRLAIIFDFLH